MFSATKPVAVVVVVMFGTRSPIRIFAFSRLRTRMRGLASNYSTSDTGAAAGYHTYTARAVDTSGAVTTSAPVTVLALPPNAYRRNVAALGNGASASASSTANAHYPASAVINSDVKGTNWGAGGGWSSGTLGATPEWVQVRFAGPQTISEIDVYSIQTNPSAPVTPTLDTPFTQNGLTDYRVQTWDGTTWQDVPGGNVSANNLVWRRFSFSPVITERIRVLISGELAKARCKTQIDIGFGDAVTPGPVDATYPVLLDDLPAPHLRTYPVYTVVAEKLHAIALLGMTNSRVKDYLDLSVLLERESLDIDLLAQAVKATFERRGMAVPAALPVGMTDEFAHDTSRQAMWQAFLKKNELAPEPLAAIVVRLRAALEPALHQAAR